MVLAGFGWFLVGFGWLRVLQLTCELKKKIEKSLNEKATVFKNFDNDIFKLIDEADVDTLLTEIQDSSNLSDETNETRSLKSNIC